MTKAYINMWANLWGYVRRGTIITTAECKSQPKLLTGAWERLTSNEAPMEGQPPSIHGVIIIVISNHQHSSKDLSFRHHKHPTSVANYVDSCHLAHLWHEAACRRQLLPPRQPPLSHGMLWRLQLQGQMPPAFPIYWTRSSKAHFLSPFTLPTLLFTMYETAVFQGAVNHQSAEDCPGFLSRKPSPCYS